MRDSIHTGHPATRARIAAPSSNTAVVPRDPEPSKLTNDEIRRIVHDLLG
ncbi:hypothetical protein [Roseomonas sp. BN140053]